MIAPPSERTYRTVFAIAFIAGGFTVGFGVHAIVTPEPETVTETVIHDAPPACAEIRPAVQAERASATRVADTHEAVLAESIALSDVALTGDEAAILAQAEALDDAKRAEQDARLALGSAQADLDGHVDDCTPERDS